MKKWFADGEITLYALNTQLTSDSMVFDLGGYLGDFTAAIIERYNCKAYILSLIQNIFPNASKDFLLIKM